MSIGFGFGTGYTPTWNPLVPDNPWISVALTVSGRRPLRRTASR
jgi:hypothetical protein